MMTMLNAGVRIGLAGLLLSVSPVALGQFGVHISDPIAAHGNAATDIGDDFGNQIASIRRGEWLSMARSNESVGGQYGTDFDILGSRSVDGGYVWTDPFAINLDAPSDEGKDRGPQYAHDGNGQWIVVWYRGNIEQSGGADQDVFYATSKDFCQTWSDPVDLMGDSYTDGENEDHPQVATDGRGRWMIVWASKRTLGGRIGTDYDILMVRSDGSFDQWTSPTAINLNADVDSGDDRIVQISTNGTGTWIVAWHSNDTLGGNIGGDRDILFARSDDNGETWSDPRPLNTNAASDSGSDSFVQLTNDGAGHWIAAWDSTENLGGRIGSDQDILYATSSDDGRTWSDPWPLNTNADVDEGDDETPQIKTDGSGNWVTVWSSTDSLDGRIGNDLDALISRSSDHGAVWTAPAPASTFAHRDGGAADHYPHLAFDGYGNWLVQWRSSADGGMYGNDWDVFVAQFFLPTDVSPVLYVDQSAPQGGDGRAWKTAFVDLQQALDLAAFSGSVQEIWVAAGDYHPDRRTDDRSETFRLVDGVGLYGGFAGDEVNRQDRDPVANPTILTGDIGVVGVTEDNSYNVVTSSNTGPDTILDGFEIALGWADGGAGHDRGAGLYNDSGSPTIKNCRFLDHYAYGVGGEQATGDGAAIFNHLGSPVVSDCYFARNVARRRGGAVFNDGGSAEFRGCKFVENRIIGGALGDSGGGAVFNYRSSPTYEDCYFESNSGGDGGSFYNHFSDTLMLRCDFYNNDGRYGASVHNYDGAPILAYCTFRENDTRGRFLTRNAGAVFNRDSLPIIVNCLMVDNYAWRGGAMYNINSRPRMINCSIINNVSTDNSATMHNLNSRPVIQNCILWNPEAVGPEISDLFDSETRVFYSNVRGGWPGNGNLDIDPQVIFIDGHYPLLPLSPMIDAGNNNAVPSALTIDLLGNPRRIDDPDVPDTGHGSAPVVDIGAYERRP